MKRRVTSILLSSFIVSSISLFSQDESFIRLNPKASYLMMEPNQDLRKVKLFANLQASEAFKPGSLIFGVSLVALADYQHSNTDSKFGYLMRHPTAKNQIGYDVSEAVIHSFQLSCMGSVTPWFSAYAELLYSPEQSFGTGTITSLERNQIQLRKAFVYFGNLNKFPIYGAIGKMDAPFGLTNSVSPFTNSTMWHAFGGLGYGAQIGFYKWNLHITLMAVQGGSQFRAMNTIVGDSTDVPSLLNNFVGDINYTLYVQDLLSVRFGYSYLYGSAYGQGFPITHFNPSEINNPASSIYAAITLGSNFLVQGAYAITHDVWPGAHNPEPPLDVYDATPVSSYSIGAKYSFGRKSDFRYVFSGEFSNFNAGPEGCPWERQNQLVGGFSLLIKQSNRIFLEVFQTQGYVPLNFMSGSDPFDPFPPGETHSDRDANSIGFVLGALITL